MLVLTVGLNVLSQSQAAAFSIAAALTSMCPGSPLFDARRAQPPKSRRDCALGLSAVAMFISRLQLVAATFRFALATSLLFSPAGAIGRE